MGKQRCKVVPRREGGWEVWFRPSQTTVFLYYVLKEHSGFVVVNPYLIAQPYPEFTTYRAARKHINNLIDKRLQMLHNVDT